MHKENLRRTCQELAGNLLSIFFSEIFVSFRKMTLYISLFNVSDCTKKDTACHTSAARQPQQGNCYTSNTTAPVRSEKRCWVQYFMSPNSLWELWDGTENLADGACLSGSQMMHHNFQSSSHPRPQEHSQGEHHWGDYAGFWSIYSCWHLQHLERQVWGYSLSAGFTEHQADCSRKLQVFLGYPMTWSDNLLR